MSGSATRMLFIAVGMLISASASAFELDGAWTTDATNCAKVFVKENNRVSMARNSDFYGGGFIVEGNQIRGPAKACKITNRKEDAGVLHLIATCATEIALLGSEQVSLKIDGDNKVFRIYPSFPDMGTAYFRCKL